MAAKKTPAKKSTPKKAAAKKAGPSPKKSTAQTRAEQWVSKINKSQKFKGKAQVRMASEVRTPYHLRRPTGVLGLDIALGGGFHAGGGVQIYGSESVGKTYLAFKTIAEHQRIYGEDATALIFGTEIRTDKGFARKAGVCVGYSDYEISEFEEIRVRDGLPKFTKDEVADLKKNIGTIVFQAAETADVGFDVIVDALREDVFNIVLIESLGALITEAMGEKDVGAKHVGGSAGVITMFQNKIYPLFMLDRDEEGSILETTIIGINQARAEMDRPSPRSPKIHEAAGAFAWKHGQLANIELRKGVPIREKAGEPPIGRVVNWKIAKGKAGTHDGLAGEYDYYHVPRGDPVFWKDVEEIYMGGVDSVTDAYNAAKKLGVIQAAGAWLTWEDLEGNTVIRANGKAKFVEELAQNTEEYVGLLRQQCLKKSGLLVRWR